MAGFIISLIVSICFVLSLGAPQALAQQVDCSGGCTETFYGLGNDPQNGPFEGTIIVVRTSPPGDPSCGPEQPVAGRGRVKIREQDTCVVSSSTRCHVEIPLVPLQSGYGTSSSDPLTLDLGPVGLLVITGSTFTDYEGNQGYRQLLGTCTLDAGEECALDSDCPSLAGCRSTCFSEPGTTCASVADCPASDCRTEIEWDGIGTCTDDATLCTSDDDCPAGEFCESAFESHFALSSCACCQSTLGVLCPSVSPFFVEYPAISCPLPTTAPLLRGAPDWEFEGGAGTRFKQGTVCPGIQEGVCLGNRQRPCGASGDFWAGAANNKCEGSPPCPNPFDPANLAIASTCDEVPFGGIEGDVCDFCESGYRVGQLEPDGSQNLSMCGSYIHNVGAPMENCAVPIDVPDGDPQPGCPLNNFGIQNFPDWNCNEVLDFSEGRCHPDGATTCTTDADCGSGICVNDGDLCPFLAEGQHFLDSNGDNRGDECQCGDANGDGAISNLDIAGAALCANGVVVCDSTRVDADGDGSTTANDIGGIVSVVNGAITTTELLCLRDIETFAP